MSWLSVPALPLVSTPPLFIAGKWTVQQAADLAVAAPTITSSLDGRYMSALRPERLAAAKVFGDLGCKQPGPIAGVDKQQLISDVKQVGGLFEWEGTECSAAQRQWAWAPFPGSLVSRKPRYTVISPSLSARQALYASKICSYAQGMNIIKAKSDEMKWGVNLGGLARIWKVRAIVNAQRFRHVES
jgi:6-phosphogluconate dehydrogenase